MECLDIKSFQQDTVTYNKQLARYVGQSLKQENVGIVDVQMIYQIIQKRAVDSISLHYRETVGFIEAYHHLHQLSKDRDGGLLENNLICEAHKILMNHRKHLCTIGKYSRHDRLVEFEGHVHFYTRTVGEDMLKSGIVEMNSVQKTAKKSTPYGVTYYGTYDLRMIIQI